MIASTKQPARRKRTPCSQPTTPVLAGVPSARRSCARSNKWAWSHEPEARGLRHAPKRHDFRDTHSELVGVSFNVDFWAEPGWVARFRHLLLYQGDFLLLSREQLFQPKLVPVPSSNAIVGIRLSDSISKIKNSLIDGAPDGITLAELESGTTAGFNNPGRPLKTDGRW